MSMRLIFRFLFKAIPLDVVKHVPVHEVKGTIIFDNVHYVNNHDYDNNYVNNVHCECNNALVDFYTVL